MRTQSPLPLKKNSVNRIPIEFSLQEVLVSFFSLSLDKKKETRVEVVRWKPKQNPPQRKKKDVDRRTVVALFNLVLIPLLLITVQQLRNPVKPGKTQ